MSTEPASNTSDPETSRGADYRRHPVLPRQRLDAPPAALAAPAPRVPTLARPFSAVGLDRHSPDVALVADWMNRDHLVRTWEYPNPESWWREHIGAQAEGDYSRPILLRHQDDPVAYVELYRPAQDSIADRYDADPYDLGAHIAFGDTADTGRGLATEVLSVFLTELWATEPDCTRLIGDPDHRNTAARSLLEASGAEFLGIHEMSNRTMALYALHRPRGT